VRASRIVSLLVWLLVSSGASLGAACGTGSGPARSDAAAPGDGRAAADATPAADAGPTGDAPPAAADPGLPGAYDVVVDDGRTVPTPSGDETATVYEPSIDGGATAAAGPFPLVVVSTGYMIGRGNYDGTCRHLASWGYVVVSHDYAGGNHQDHAAGVSAILDWALGGASGLAGRIDATRIATAGHSMGGKVSILAAILDSRVDAVVGWDPVDALPPIADGSYSVTPEQMDGLTVPIAVLGETTDGGSGGRFGSACAPAADNFHQFFSHACAAPAALEVTIDGADHTEWVDSRQACGLACLVCSTGSTDGATVLSVTRRVTVAWLETYLRGTPGMDAWLAEPAVGGPTHVAGDPGC
jgi:dienelactone hydrolase